MDQTVDYRAKHIVKSVTPSTSDAVRQALKQRLRAQLSIALWRGYTNILLDHTKYVGD